MHTCKERKCTLKPARECKPYAEIHSILAGTGKWRVPLPSKQQLLSHRGLPGSNAVLRRDSRMARATALFSSPSSCYASVVIRSD